MCATPYKRSTRNSSSESSAGASRSSAGTRTSNRSTKREFVPLELPANARRSKRTIGNVDSIPLDKQTPVIQPDAAEEGRLFTAATDLDLAELSEIERGRPEQPAPLAPAVAPLGVGMHSAADIPNPTSGLAQTSELANKDHVPKNDNANKEEAPTSATVDEDIQKSLPTVTSDVSLTNLTKQSASPEIL